MRVLLFKNDLVILRLYYRHTFADTGATMKNLSDQELFQLIKLGNRRAFTVLFDRHGSLLFHHIYQRIQSNADTDETLQNIFYRFR